MRQRIALRGRLDRRCWGPFCCSGSRPAPASPAGATGALIADGDFEASQTSTDLRNGARRPGWYESRRDGKEGRALLQLSQKPVAGNATLQGDDQGEPGAQHLPLAAADRLRRPGPSRSSGTSW